MLNSFNLVICFIQEHWLFREHLGSLNISNDFLSVGVSGMDSSEILVGHPFGSCGILLVVVASFIVNHFPL